VIRASALGAILLLVSVGCRTAPAPAPAPPADVATEYDLVYAISHNRVSFAPSPFLVSSTRGLAPGTAVDIGSGNGRNSLYLARRGFHVTAVDLSRVGLDLTRQAAEAEHLPVTTLAEDINQFDFGRNRWDLIVLIDFPFSYRALLPRIAAGLKPGGEVVIQAVSSHQPGSLDSPDHSLRYTFMRHADLRGPFAGFSVLHDSEAEEPTVWGVKAIMIRVAAQKPTS